MRHLLLILTALAVPTLGLAQTQETGNDKQNAINRNTINGDISGDIEGAQEKRYFYKNPRNTRENCFKTANGDQICD